MKKTIIAVDGPAGSGKSSVSRRVAAELGLTYIDSGALYRSITWFVLQRDGAITKEFTFTKDIAALRLTQKFLSTGKTRTFVNDTDVTDLIRDETIAKNIGIISDNREVRDFVNGLLRKWSGEESIIIDGRDIGTVTFPDADVKIYLDASVEKRAERRMKEYRELGKNVDENIIKNQIILRDEQDKTRKYGGLVRSDDAVYMDTSHMNMEQVIRRIKEVIMKVDKN
jgi:cytidylate kinase